MNTATAYTGHQYSAARAMANGAETIHNLSGLYVETAAGFRKVCGKCDGTGSVSWGEPANSVVMGPNGAAEVGLTCYRCGGMSYTGKPVTRETVERRGARADREAAKRAAEAAANAARFAAENYLADWDAAIAENTERDALAARIAASRHLDAELGAKVTIEGAVTVAATFETPSFNGYGTDLKRVIAVKLATGESVKMFTAARWAFDTAKGDTVTIAGIVKAHGTDRDGLAETTLNRPRRTA